MHDGSLKKEEKHARGYTSEFILDNFIFQRQILVVLLSANLVVFYIVLMICLPTLGIQIPLKPAKSHGNILFLLGIKGLNSFMLLALEIPKL